MAPTESPYLSNLNKLDIILERLKLIMTNLICISIRLNDPATFFNNSTLITYLARDLHDIKFLFDELINDEHVATEEDAHHIESKMRSFLLIVLNSLL